MLASIDGKWPGLIQAGRRNWFLGSALQGNEGTSNMLASPLTMDPCVMKAP